MRFASAMFDKYRSSLADISDFSELDRWMDSVSLEKQFLDYVYAKEGLRAGEKEWKESRAYMMPQVKALVGRYSKLDDEAFYRFYLPVDDALQQALKHSSTID